MREEIAKKLYYQDHDERLNVFPWDKLSDHTKDGWLLRADAILAIPVGNATLGEVIEMLPGMVKEMRCLGCPIGNCIGTDLSHCAYHKALTLTNGEMLEVEK